MLVIPSKQKIDAYNKLADETKKVFDELLPVVKEFDGLKIINKSTDNFTKKFKDKTTNVLEKYNNQRFFQFFILRDYGLVRLQSKATYEEDFEHFGYVYQFVTLGTFKDNKFLFDVKNKWFEKKYNYDDVVRLTKEYNEIEKELRTKLSDIKKQIIYLI